MKINRFGPWQPKSYRKSENEELEKGGYFSFYKEINPKTNSKNEAKKII